MTHRLCHAIQTLTLTSQDNTFKMLQSVSPQEKIEICGSSKSMNGTRSHTVTLSVSRNHDSTPSPTNQETLRSFGLNDMTRTPQITKHVMRHKQIHCIASTCNRHVTCTTHAPNMGCALHHKHHTSSNHQTRHAPQTHCTQSPCKILMVQTHMTCCMHHARTKHNMPLAFHAIHAVRSKLQIVMASPSII